MMLSELELLPVYDSAEYDLVHDLIVPLLESSISYIRGVGFFTSGWLRVAARGLVPFAERGGTARFIVSPILSEDDLASLELGAKARNDRAMHELLARSLTSLEEGLETQTRNALAWMVADEVLDFRIAVPRPAYRAGDYHDKIGVFTDQEGHKVAVHGSLNDTVRGSLNGESFSVFQSWVEGESKYVSVHQSRLQQLWDHGNAQFSTYDVPQAIREGFVKLRSDDRPYKIDRTRGRRSIEGTLSTELKCPFPLRDYQDEAIQSWEEAGCRGILEMATGTGKTYTALGAAAKRYRTNGSIAVIIEVPYIHLVDQWEDACAEFGLDVITCSSAHGHWGPRLAEAVLHFRRGVRPNLGVVAAHQTASSGRFMRALRGLPRETLLLIADEVHGLGAKHLQNAMLDSADMRLGLSATPDRWFDPDGTAAIKGYFGDVCFDFPLSRAIEEGFLVPYDYEPCLCRLSHDETEEYSELSSVIRSLLGAEDEVDIKRNPRLSNLLIRRARLVGQAAAKLPLLLEKLMRMQEEASRSGAEVQHVLVYCAPGTHDKVLRAVSTLGLRCHEFTASIGSKQRQEVLRHFASGDIQVLIAIRCLDEGVDVPATQTAFILASTTNPRQFVQRRGRVLRNSPRKERATVHDFIVIGGEPTDVGGGDVGSSLLRREMPRFVEFSRDAINQFAARRAVWDILDRRGMLNLLEKTPWEIYRELPVEDHDSANEIGGS